MPHAWCSASQLLSSFQRTAVAEFAAANFVLKAWTVIRRSIGAPIPNITSAVRASELRRFPSRDPLLLWSWDPVPVEGVSPEIDSAVLLFVMCV